jgi:hypothetical protein
LYQLQHLLNNFLRRRAWKPAQLQAKGDVLLYGHMLEKHVVLKDHAHAALLRRKVIDAKPCKVNLTSVGFAESRDDAQKGCLAAA